MSKAVPPHVKDIREQAKSASLKAVAGFSPLSILNSAQALADAGLGLEHDGDLRGALFKYSQAAILLDHIMGSAEYKHETPKSQRGVLYHQTAKLSEFVIGDILPRAKKIEERLREIEQSKPQPPSPAAAETDGRPMGSLRDRMRMLEQAGLDVGNQPQRPSKPAKPTVDSAPTRATNGAQPHLSYHRERGHRHHRTHTHGQKSKSPRWHFGIRSRSPPMEVMLEIYQTLKTLGMEWREKPGLNIIGRPEDEGAPGKDGKDIYYVETRCRIRDVVVRMDLQLYQVDPLNYLVDFRNLGCHHASTDPSAPSKFTDASWPGSDSNSSAPRSPTLTEGAVLRADVCSPFLFLECACRLIVELAAG
ncbi:unnamed protein product [Rhizoctonia solani]|uniref:AMPK C-terminal adenylate sensor domain-containing protein n=1 Tax=Rhizoctonia solani TaxID=456999 RepID=A0A8H3HX58_9AGAM|nr:unnamed protein product [Rhizoctonia solani]